MQIVSNGDTLNEMSNPIFWGKKKKKKKNTNLSFAEFAKRGVIDNNSGIISSSFSYPQHVFTEKLEKLSQNYHYSLTTLK